MSWTTPRTWTPGETVTASIMNTHVRDNLIDLNGRIPYSIGAYAYRTTAQSISSASWATMSWSTTAYDTDSLWSVGSPTRLTVPTGKGGLWQIQWNVRWNIITVNNVRIMSWPVVNATAQTAWMTENSTSTSQYQTSGATVNYNLSAGDYIEIQVYQDTGAAVNIRASENFFGLYYLGPALT